LEDNKLIGISRYSRHPAFLEFEYLIIPDSETYASNTLSINGTVLIPKGYPKTAEILKQSDFDVIQLATSEFARCEGALTCLSIIF
ncbi:MAG: amidinotransferase, partial [Candidatus Thorarchaeota archaeon]